MLKIDHASITTEPKGNGDCSVDTVVICHGHLFLWSAKNQEEFYRMFGADADSSWIVQNMLEVLPEKIAYAEVCDFVQYLGNELSKSMEEE